MTSPLLFLAPILNSGDFRHHVDFFNAMVPEGVINANSKRTRLGVDAGKRTAIHVLWLPKTGHSSAPPCSRIRCEEQQRDGHEAS